MISDDTSISTKQIPVRSTYKTNDRSLQFHHRTGIKHKAPGENTTKSDITTPSTDRIMFNKLEGANASAQDVAQKIRTIDQTIGRIDQHVQQMKGALDKILKSYPPFPVDSDERIAQLRQYSSLRKMIDQLTIPPTEDDSSAVILGDNHLHPAAGDWEFVPGPESEKMVIRHQAMHTGPQGLDIPDLPLDAQDNELVETLDRLEVADTTLKARRAAFVADANRVIAAIV